MRNLLRILTIAGIVLFLIAVFTVMGGFFFILNRPLGPVAYVVGSLHSDNNLIRAVVTNGDTGQTLIDATLTIRSHNETLATANIRDDRPVTMRYKPTNSAVQLVVSHSSLDKPYVVTLAPSTRPPEVDDLGRRPGRLRNSDDDEQIRSNKDWRGPLNLTLFPSTDIALALPDSLLFVVHDANFKPTPAILTITKTVGLTKTPLPKTIRTDKLGIAHLNLNATTPLRIFFDITPIDSDTRQTHSPSQATPQAKAKATSATSRHIDKNDLSETSSGSVEIAGAMPQVSLYVPQVIDNTAISASATSVHRNKLYFLDVANDNDAVDYHRAIFTTRTVRVQLPTSHLSPGKLYYLQAYGSIYGTENGWDSRYFWYDPSLNLSSCNSAIDSLADRLKTNYGVEWEPWFKEMRSASTQLSTCKTILAAMVEMLPKQFMEPVIMANTKEAELQKLEEWKEKTKASLLNYLTILLIGGGLATAVSIARAFLKKRNEIKALEAMMLDVNVQTDRGETVYLVTMIVSVTLILIGFGYSLVMLMSKV